MIYKILPKFTDKVHIPHAENLIVRVDIVNCILKHILIDSVADISFPYIVPFREMGLLPLMLTPPPSMLRSFSNDSPFTIDTIHLPI